MSVKPVAWTPWIVGEHKEWDKEIPIIGDTEHYKQAKFAWVDNDDICHGEDAETRALLIASAPELAEALQKLVKAAQDAKVIILQSDAPYQTEVLGDLGSAIFDSEQLLARITPK